MRYIISMRVVEDTWWERLRDIFRGAWYKPFEVSDDIPQPMMVGHMMNAIEKEVKTLMS